MAADLCGFCIEKHSRKRIYHIELEMIKKVWREY